VRGLAKGGGTLLLTGSRGPEPCPRSLPHRPSIPNPPSRPFHTQPHGAAARPRGLLWPQRRPRPRLHRAPPRQPRHCAAAGPERRGAPGLGAAGARGGDPPSLPACLLVCKPPEVRPASQQQLTGRPRPRPSRLLRSGSWASSRRATAPAAWSRCWTPTLPPTSTRCCPWGQGGVVREGHAREGTLPCSRARRPGTPPARQPPTPHPTPGHSGLLALPAAPAPARPQSAVETVELICESARPASRARDAAALPTTVTPWWWALLVLFKVGAAGRAGRARGGAWRGVSSRASSNPAAAAAAQLASPSARLSLPSLAPSHTPMRTPRPALRRRQYRTLKNYRSKDFLAARFPDKIVQVRRGFGREGCGRARAPRAAAGALAPDVGGGCSTVPCLAPPLPPQALVLSSLYWGIGEAPALPWPHAPLAAAARRRHPCPHRTTPHLSCQRSSPPSFPPLLFTHPPQVRTSRSSTSSTSPPSYSCGPPSPRSAPPHSAPPSSWVRPCAAGMRAGPGPSAPWGAGSKPPRAVPAHAPAAINPWPSSTPPPRPPPADRPLFIRERHDGLYRVGTYLLSRIIEGGRARWGLDGQVDGWRRERTLPAPFQHGERPARRPTLQACRRVPSQPRPHPLRHRPPQSWASWCPAASWRPSSSSSRCSSRALL
jgi:hypothetical protein